MSRTLHDLGPQPELGDTIIIGGTEYILSGYSTGANSATSLGFELYPAIQGGADDGASDDDADDDSSSDSGDDTDDDKSDDAGKEKEGKTFTQDQVNAMLAKEVSRKTRGKLDPKELGFENAKDLKAFLDEQKEKSEAEKSEADKALETAIAEASKKAEEGVLAKANARVLKAEFKIAASAAHVRFLDDAFALAQTLEIWQDVQVDDEGNVTGLDEDFFKSLEEAKPFLFTEDEGDEGGSDIGGGRRRGKGDAAKFKEQDIRTKYPALNS